MTLHTWIISFNLLFFVFNVLIIPQGNALPINGHRVTRQTNSDRSQLIDNIFQIPIQTLLAVNNLVQSSRGVLRRQTQVSAPKSLAADVAGVRQQTDGSAYRI